jgi:hypothetical protein
LFDARYNQQNTQNYTKVSKVIMAYQRSIPPFRRDRQNKTGGGVIVYVKEHINCNVRPDLQIDNIECLWIEIKLKKKRIYMEPTLIQTRDHKILHRKYKIEQHKF